MTRIIVLGTSLAEPVTALEEKLASLPVVFGPKRWRSRIRHRDFRAWPSPFSNALDEIAAVARENAEIGVVATGDPLHFGIARALVRRFGADAVEVHPAPSSFSLACARLGWAQEDVGCLSLHGGPGNGRGVEALSQWIAPGRRLVVLSEHDGTPRETAEWLLHRGFGDSRLHVLGNMGGEGEWRWDGRATDPQPADIPSFNTLAIDCRAGGRSEWLPLTGGLPDGSYAHDGQLTKSDVRALVISRLRPRPGGKLWDIGAGCGSVGIEWLRLSPGGAVHAVERDEKRVALVVRNAEAFGLAHLSVVHGDSPEALADLPEPDAIFMGGGLSDPRGFEACWAALPEGGTLCATAVTLEGEARLAQLHAEHGGSLVRVSTATVEEVGRFRGWRPAMPVTLWSVERSGR